MREKIERLFNSKPGKEIYKTVIDTIKSEGMYSKLEKGVLVGLSGGADSVMLLIFLYHYRNKHPEISILSTHINHLIREEEAKRDLLFSSELSSSLGIEFVSKEIDVPKIARESKCGIEETARKVRYDAFSDIISSRNDIGTISVAHNATDNVETMVFNMLRGSGIRGIAGIPPVRDNVIRPLIRIPKADIEKALLEFDIPFVTDSTNLSTDYSRNYIRHEILPKFRQICTNPEQAMQRLSDILRENASYFDYESKKFLSENLIDGAISLKKLLSLKAAMLQEVIKSFLESRKIECEYTHVNKICSLLGGKDFSLDLPKGYTFVSERDRCYLSKKNSEDEFSFSFPLKLGLNEFEGINGAIILSETKLTDSYSKIYKIAIQQIFPFDIINKGLLVRSKAEGDKYRYSGMTHKLKKMFNDRKIPLRSRPFVPIICDNEGILWPVGFSKRDLEVPKDADRSLYIALAFNNSLSANKSFYFKQNNNSKTKGS